MQGLAFSIAQALSGRQRRGQLDTLPTAAKPEHTTPIPRTFMQIPRALALAAAFSLATATAVQAEVYPKKTLTKVDKKEAGGGKGTLSGEYAFTRDQPTKDQAIKEISWLTLQPGDSIGYHKHTTNEDTYIIVSGNGTFRDKDGKDHPVKAGDVTIVRKNEAHGLVNTGTVPLVFVDVIAEQ
jgi:mannose-6-phosphate isomerase-like protein (cupin superfamily)